MRMIYGAYQQNQVEANKYKTGVLVIARLRRYRYRWVLDTHYATNLWTSGSKIPTWGTVHRVELPEVHPTLSKEEAVATCLVLDIFDSAVRKLIGNHYWEHTVQLNSADRQKFFTKKEKLNGIRVE